MIVWDILGEVLTVVGLVTMTIGVLGMFRMPDVYGQAHSASKGAVVGLLLILVATLTVGEWEIAARSLLIGAYLIVTLPVSSHVILRAAAARGEPLEAEEAVDERPLEPPSLDRRATPPPVKDRRAGQRPRPR